MSDPATTGARIIDQLRRIHDGDAWHGPSVREALDGVTANDAVRRPIPGAHSIYELTHHIAAWVGEVDKRLGGRPPQLPEDGDFPDHVTDLDEAAWEALKSLVAARHAALAESIQNFDSARFAERVGSERDAPLGSGVTYYALLHGLIQHDAYHAGQIMLLRRALAR